ncbi:MAG: phosphoribosylformylglycinamidine synthase subunit PurQ [Gemmatimonadaceae bacterium]|nr:phosphoribosylformylglycinamidine synthase subunit PurQ [Gemmatimonadaceae bacterium]
MKFGIVTFPGSNCDYDAYRAAVDVMEADAEYLWHKDQDLKGADIIILPGGFSYGDYLRPGAIARFSPIMNSVIAHAKRGAPVLAVCNGFQIACEAGLLPGALLRNESLHFVSDRAGLIVENAETLFTSEYVKGEQLEMPVAHGDGRFFADERVLDEIEGQGQVVFRYTDNPNGSARDIAGIVNREGNVLGMMPHPERALDMLLGSEHGLPLFQSLMAGALR